MKKTLAKLGCTFALSVLASWSATAQDSGALVDALVKKGVLSNQEGEEIRADLLKEAAATPAGKMNVASYVTQLKLYGDARFRYQSTTRYNYTGNGTRGTQGGDRDRMRYRVRVGADYSLTDNFKAGVRLETSPDHDSTNATFNDGYDKDPIYIGLAYMQWMPNFDFIPEDLDITITGGKQKPTFFLDWANWDTDINPTGVSENFAYTGLSGFEFGANTGQYIYANRNNNAVAPGFATNNDSWQLINQVYVKATWAPNSSVQVAPALLNDVNTNGPQDVLAGTALGAGANPGNANTRYANYDILYIPVEVKWKMWEQPFKAYYTYGHNFSANQIAMYNQGRALAVNPGLVAPPNGPTPAQLAGQANKGRDESDSHVLGLQVGDTKLKGQWMLDGSYIYREAYSVSPNLTDSDWAQQAGNARGFVVRAAYAFTDSVVGQINYMYSEPINKAGITPNTALKTNTDDAQVIQVDLSVKF